MLYKAPNSSSGVDRARHDLFQKGKEALEKLPPTNDALELYMSRANYQAKVWLQANKADVVVPDPEETGGWQATDSRLEVVWLRKPSVPSSCLEVVRLLVDANASAAHKLAVATRWDNHVYLHVTVLLKDA